METHRLEQRIEQRPTPEVMLATVQAQAERLGELFPVTAEQVEPVTLEQLSPSERQPILDQLFTELSKVLSGVDQYWLFGSAALYLNMQHRREMIEQLPAVGDIDIYTTSTDQLERLMQRLINFPEHSKLVTVVHLEAGGKRQPIRGESTRVISGSLQLDTAHGKLMLPFELFVNPSSREDVVVTDKAIGSSRTLQGLSVLDVDGLAEQNQRLMKRERKASMELSDIVEHFQTDTPTLRVVQDLFSLLEEQAGMVEQSDLSPDMVQLLEHYSITPRQLVDFYRLYEHEPERAVQGFLPFKLKLEQRQRTVERLRQLQTVVQ